MHTSPPFAIALKVRRLDKSEKMATTETWAKKGSIYEISQKGSVLI